MRYYLIVILFLAQSSHACAQQVKDFFYANDLPVFVRGNLSQNVILLYIQGGGGETAIDFARADYPRWKNSLEQRVAIAYYDQRGLNMPVGKIDSTKITFEQYSNDLIDLAETLSERYSSRIILMGHSLGGHIVLHAASRDLPPSIVGAILMNTPITTDFSPERYRKYRPMFLRNLASEFIAAGNHAAYWQQALDWMNETDSIYSVETSRQWNEYVDTAFSPTKRRISPLQALKVIFSKPYDPVSYLNRKDNRRVSDLLWHAEEDMDFFSILEEINLPVLLVTGRYDNIATPEEQEVALKLLSDGKLKIIPDGGHALFLDQPGELNEEITAFISQLNRHANRKK